MYITYNGVVNKDVTNQGVTTHLIRVGSEREWCPFLSTFGVDQSVASTWMSKPVAPLCGRHSFTVTVTDECIPEFGGGCTGPQMYPAAYEVRFEPFFSGYRNGIEIPWSQGYSSADVVQSYVIYDSSGSPLPRFINFLSAGSQTFSVVFENGCTSSTPPSTTTLSTTLTSTTTITTTTPACSPWDCRHKPYFEWDWELKPAKDFFDHMEVKTTSLGIPYALQLTFMIELNLEGQITYWCSFGPCLSHCVYVEEKRNATVTPVEATIPIPISWSVRGPAAVAAALPGVGQLIALARIYATVKEIYSKSEDVLKKVELVLDNVRGLLTVRDVIRGKHPSRCTSRRDEEDSWNVTELSLVFNISEAGRVVNKTLDPDVPESFCQVPSWVGSSFGEIYGLRCVCYENETGLAPCSIFNIAGGGQNWKDAVCHPNLCQRPNPVVEQIKLVVKNSFVSWDHQATQRFITTIAFFLKRDEQVIQILAIEPVLNHADKVQIVLQLVDSHGVADKAAATALLSEYTTIVGFTIESATGESSLNLAYVISLPIGLAVVFTAMILIIVLSKRKQDVKKPLDGTGGIPLGSTAETSRSRMLLDDPHEERKDD